MRKYRGRIAPSPTGLLHIGHAMTFWCAQQRAHAAGGTLVLRIEDVDRDRCRSEFTTALIEDLRWFGLHWDEGPDNGGAFAPYVQSERQSKYLAAWRTLRDGGFIYPCKCSRKDVVGASLAPHEENQEPIYPGTCRPDAFSVEATVPAVEKEVVQATGLPLQTPGSTHWRFRIPDGERIEFFDQHLGIQSAVAGCDFGDFIVWRRDNIPAYQLAVVVDDAAMQISEVVRGKDLLVSTFRQLLLYRALRLLPPKFFHVPLLLDESGKRLAKRHGSLSLRTLRECGTEPEELRALYTSAGSL
jgi:glutamyl/glutaminyl-tRNA synthetase